MQTRLGYYIGHLHKILKNSKYKCKKTVVNHLVNGSTVLLRIENSKNDRLKVILLCSMLTFSQTATTYNSTFSLIRKYISWRKRC